MVQTSNQLPKRALGKTGVQVSCIGMGCSPFGHAYGVRHALCPLSQELADSIASDTKLTQTLLLSLQTRMRQ